MRIELSFEALVNASQRRSEWREDALCSIAAAEQRGMASKAMCAPANLLGRQGGSQPTQRAAPLDQLRSIDTNGLGGGWQREPPQRRIAFEERRRVFANVAPESLCFDGFTA